MERIDSVCDPCVTVGGLLPQVTSDETQTERPARSSLATQTAPAPPTRDDAAQADDPQTAEQLDKLKKVGRVPGERMWGSVASGRHRGLCTVGCVLDPVQWQNTSGC